MAKSKDAGSGTAHLYDKKFNAQRGAKRALGKDAIEGQDFEIVKTSAGQYYWIPLVRGEAEDAEVLADHPGDDADGVFGDGGMYMDPEARDATIMPWDAPEAAAVDIAEGENGEAGSSGAAVLASDPDHGAAATGVHAAEAVGPAPTDPDWPMDEAGRKLAWSELTEDQRRIILKGAVTALKAELESPAFAAALQANIDAGTALQAPTFADAVTTQVDDDEEPQAAGDDGEGEEEPAPASLALPPESYGLTADVLARLMQVARAKGAAVSPKPKAPASSRYFDQGYALQPLQYPVGSPQNQSYLKRADRMLKAATSNDAEYLQMVEVRGVNTYAKVLRHYLDGLRKRVADAAEMMDRAVVVGKLDRQVA